jgi:hypothetical protein
MNSSLYCLNSLMSFLDKAEYDDATMFSQERLAAVTNINVYWYLANKACGTLEPGHDDLPEKCRSTTIKYHKKAISLYMPRRNMVWNEVQKEGNPTKSQAVNNLIKEIERQGKRDGSCISSLPSHQMG